MSLSSSSIIFDAKTQAVIRHKGYEMGVKLGAGAFGVVFKAYQRSSHQFAAVKVLSLNSMDGESRTKFLPRELTTLITARHENLVAVYDIFRANNRVFIFMEFACNGDISAYAKKHKGVPERTACTWFYQTASGLAFLHNELLTAHRDIKLENILLADGMVAKLSDFGLAKMCYDTAENRPILCRTWCGTKPYESPQIVEHKPYNAFKADVWSMGVALFIMLHDRFPYHHRDKKQFIGEMWNYPGFLRSRYVTHGLAPGAGRLLEAMLHPVEERRASVEDLLSNEYLTSRIFK